MSPITAKAAASEAEPKHTPGPWSVGDRKLWVEVWGPMRNGSSPILASMEHEPREANAAFIVRAVNSHADMLAALKMAREALWQTWHSSMSEKEFRADPAVSAIDNAIAKATGAAS